MCCVLLFIILSVVHGRLQKNPKIGEIECSSIITFEQCETQSNEWCNWNNDTFMCDANYDCILFVSPLDITATSQSLISFGSFFVCVITYWFSGLLIRRLSLFSSIECDKMQKCQIYIFSLIGLTYCISYLLYHNTLNIIFHTDDYSNMTPTDTLKLIQSLSALIVLMYIYCIEMMTNKTRWNAQLHHFVIIFMIMYLQWILYHYPYLAAIRCAICLSLYALTEHTVFIQLLLYRVSPLYGWKLQLILAIIYVLSRLCITATFVYCYMDWAMTDIMISIPYLVYFILMPISVILLNIAHLQTLKALFYVAKCVYRKQSERKALIRYPRLQSLYDVFIEFDSEQNGSWTFNHFRKFIFNYSSFVNQDTIIILWSVLGFTYYDPLEDHRDNVVQEIDIAPTGFIDQQRYKRILTPYDFEDIDITPLNTKRKPKMKWRHFGKIFGLHVISKRFLYHSVHTVIRADVQILLQTVFDVSTQFGRYGDLENKETVIMQLHNEIKELIDTRKKKTTTTRYKTETEYDESRFENVERTTIEMILTPASMVANQRKHTETQTSLIYESDDGHENNDINIRQTDEFGEKLSDDIRRKLTDTDRLKVADGGNDVTGLSYRSTDALRASDTMRYTDGWKTSVYDKHDEDASDESYTEDADHLFDIMMQRERGIAHHNGGLEVEDGERNRTPSVMVGTLLVVQKMLDDETINEWI